MRKLVILLIAGSLAANVWLCLHPPVPVTVLKSSDRQAPAARIPVTADAKLLTAPDTAELATWRDRLRAAGFDEPSVRSALEGVLRYRQREQLALWRIGRLRNAWWLGGLSAPGGPSAPSQRKLFNEPLQVLLGPDPFDLADMEMRYEFLSPEKRRLLALIDLDYADLQARSPQGRSNAPTKSEIEEQQLLTREQQKDLLAALTSGERAEYDLRFGGTAATNSGRFVTMDVTEAEFRVIKPMIDSYAEEGKTLTPKDPNYLETRLRLDQRTIDQAVGLLGYDRALDYLWAVNAQAYTETVRTLKAFDLPTHNAAQLLQLAAETGVHGVAIHYDTALTAEQKRAALTVLQATVRPQLEALVPPAAQAKLGQPAIEWFTVLGDGHYAVFQPAVSGNTWHIATPVSVTSTPSGPRRVVPLPRRSRN